MIQVRVCSSSRKVPLGYISCSGNFEAKMISMCWVTDYKYTLQTAVLQFTTAELALLQRFWELHVSNVLILLTYRRTM